MDHALVSATLITREGFIHTQWPLLSYVYELAQEKRKLRVELEGLQAKLNQNSTDSHKPPSSGSPFTRRPAKPKKAGPRKK